MLVKNNFLIKIIKNHSRRFSKFVIVGGSGVVVNIGFQYILKKWGGLDYKIAGGISIEISIISNFLLNNFWTWKDIPIRSIKNFFTRLFRYNFSMIGTAFLQYILMIGITEFFKVNDLISKFIAIVIVTIINYLIHHNWTFKK